MIDILGSNSALGLPFRRCLLALEIGKRYVVFSVAREAPRHPWAVRVAFGSPNCRHSKFFQIGWTRDADYGDLKRPLLLRLHSGCIGPLLWCTHRGL